MIALAVAGAGVQALLIATITFILIVAVVAILAVITILAIVTVLTVVTGGKLAPEDEDYDPRSGD